MLRLPQASPKGDACCRQIGRWTFVALFWKLLYWWTVPFTYFPNFLSISAPKLKKLVIDDSGIGYKDIDSSTSGLVELRTPSNLLSFVYRGLVSAYILSLDYISELVGVEICVFTKPFDKEEDGRGAIRILNCLCNIKTLALKGFEPLRYVLSLSVFFLFALWW